MPADHTGFVMSRFLLVSAFVGLALGMPASITVLFAGTFGASDSTAGLVWSSIGASLLLVDLFGTRLIPRLNGRSMLIVALVVYGIGSVISGIAPTLTVMVAGRLVQGASCAFCLGGALQIVVRFSPPDRAGAAIGSFNAAWFAGIALSPAVGGGIAQLGGGQFGYRLAFVVDGAVCVLVAVTVWVLLPSLPSSLRPRIGLPSRAHAKPGLRLWPVLSLGVLGDGLRGALVFTMIPLIGSDRLGLHPGSIGLALTALSIVDITSMRYGGMLADRVGRRRVLVGALATGAITLACAPLITTYLAFVAWCALLGILVAVTWVVPAAMVVDVSSSTETGLATFRIAADCGELSGSALVGRLSTTIGRSATLCSIGGLLAVVTGWVGRLREADAVAADDCELVANQSASA